MKTTTLGKSGLEVSRIAFGTSQLSGKWGQFDEDLAVTAIRRAREVGVNFFDTAQSYGFGASEQILGKALRDELASDRDQLVIATKGGLRRTDTGVVRDASPEWLRRGVDASLAALGLDHIDLYQVHWPDPAVPAAETAGALGELIAEGKIRHAGVSNYTAGQIEEFSTTLPAETVQPPFNLFHRDIEDELLPYCHEHDIGVLVYGPLAHGLLTGTLAGDTSFAADDWRSGSDAFTGDAYRRNLVTVRALAMLAGDWGITVSQLAIAWTLAHPAVDVAIVGARRAGHVDDSAAAADVTLSEADLAEIENVVVSAALVAGPSPWTV